MKWYSVKIRTNVKKREVAVRAETSNSALLQVIRSLPKEETIKRVSVKLDNLVK